MMHSTSTPSTSDTAPVSRGSHPRSTRAPRAEIERTKRLALILIGAGLVFAVLLTIVFVKLG